MALTELLPEPVAYCKLCKKPLFADTSQLHRECVHAWGGLLRGGCQCQVPVYGEGCK